MDDLLSILDEPSTIDQPLPIEIQEPVAPPKPPPPPVIRPRKSILKAPKRSVKPEPEKPSESARVDRELAAPEQSAEVGTAPAPVATVPEVVPFEPLESAEVEPATVPSEPPASARAEPKDKSERRPKTAEQSKFISWKPKKSVDQGLIFVAIAAYRDTELLATLQSLLASSAFPDRLRFGICLQDSAAVLNGFPYYGDPRFRVIRVPADKSKGCCWARYHMQTLYNGERYYLQLDSHHRFVPEWDARCLWMLHHCRSDKPLLSTYLPPYCPETERQDVQVQDLYSIAITGYDKPGLIVFHPQKFAPDELPLDEPRLGFMIAGGFIFTFGEWVAEVPYDPSLYFNGEEVSLTVRSWTRGWDIFVPNLVVAFHYYQRTEEPKHWKDHADWRDCNKTSVERVVGQLLEGQDLGEERSLQQYQAMAGVNFAKRSSNVNAKRGLVSKNITNGFAAPEATDAFASTVQLAIDQKGWRPRANSLTPNVRKLAPKPLLQRPEAQVFPLRPSAQSSLPRGAPSALVKGRGKPISTNPSKTPLIKNLFPTPPIQGKRRIDYAGGYMAKDTSGLWHEYKGTQRFATFQQRRGRPGDDFIMLYDGTRQLHLRIDGKGVCHFIQGALDEGDWRVNFRGTWQ